MIPKAPKVATTIRVNTIDAGTEVGVWYDLGYPRFILQRWHDFGYPRFICADFGSLAHTNTQNNEQETFPAPRSAERVCDDSGPSIDSQSALCISTNDTGVPRTRIGIFGH